VAQLQAGDCIFHVQFPLGGEQTGSCIVMRVETELAEGVELRLIAPNRSKHAFTCYHPAHRYSIEEGTRLLLAGVRHGTDMVALFGNDREKYPYLERGQANGRNVSGKNVGSM